MPGRPPCRGNIIGWYKIMKVRSSSAKDSLNADSHQQLQLQLWQPPSLTAPVLTEYIVVIFNKGMSVCGAGDVNKDLNLWNKMGSNGVFVTDN